MTWPYFAAAFLFAIFPSGVMAQHNHDAGHLDYSQWQSRRTINCCNSNDCGFLKDDEWRQGVQGGEEIKIRDKWCPVKPIHYLTQGKSPDWTRAHACVVNLGNFSDDCERLLCFVGVPNT